MSLAARSMSSRTTSYRPPARCGRKLRRLYQSGEKSIGDFINAQLEFNQVAKQYLDTAIRHRRSMLGINTAVGRRLLP